MTPNAAPDMAPVELPPDHAAFEAFATACPMGRFDVTRKGGGYWSSHTQLMWDAWQAAKRQCIEASRAAVRASIFAVDTNADAPPWILSGEVAMLIGNTHRVRAGLVQDIAKQVHALMLAAPPQSAPADAPSETILATLRLVLEEVDEPQAYRHAIIDAMARRLRATPTGANVARLTDAEIRAEFEASVRGSTLKASTPLGVVTMNGAFSHYADSDTDTLWLGYRAGFARSSRMSAAAAIGEKP